MQLKLSSLNFAPMRYLGLLVLILQPYMHRAQVNIMVTDETENSFVLGLDGYLQNTQPVQGLIIQKMKAGSHVLNIHIYKDKDTVRLARPLKLEQSGNYQYVIMRNFEGRYQLRYRGKTTSFPAGIQAIEQQKIMEWPAAEIRNLALKQPEPVQVSTALPPPTGEKKPEPKAEKPNPTVTKAPPPKTAMTKAAEKAPAKPPVVPAPEPFEKLVKNLREAEFEFVRLNTAKEYTNQNPLTVNEVKTVFSYFSYDNTRLQFLNHAHEKIKDKENIKQLLETLDFELSKEQFKKKYL